MKFESYHISSELKQNLSGLGFKRPTDIQYKAIPSIMKGEDVLAIAQTGTGKTAAFAIPLIDRIQQEKKWGKSQKARKNQGRLKCIVMVPTRELAEQISRVFNELSRHTRVKTIAVYGGVEQDPQIKKIAGGVDVLVATPGRMFDLISQGVITFKNVNTLVLDEADRMLGEGFIQDIQAVKKKLTQRHQTLFFSATINKQIKKLAYSQVKSSAIRIQISPDDPVSKNVTHFVVPIEMEDKRFYLRRFIRDNEDSRIIVFVRTRVRAERVVKALERGGIKALALHGEKDQAERLEVMDRFKRGDLNIMVATDVSSRGIDIPNVHYVVNYDLPEQSENYVHRVGRTGRGVQKGVAVSFCAGEEKERLKEIETFLGKEIETVCVSKQEHVFTLSLSKDTDDIRMFIREQESQRKKKRKRKK